TPTALPATARRALGAGALAAVPAGPVTTGATPAAAATGSTSAATGAAAAATGSTSAAATATIAATTTARPATPTGALAGLADVLDLLGVQPGAGALGPGQPAGDVLGDVQVGVHVRGGGVGLRRLAQTQVQGAVDEHPPWYVVPVHERDRGAGVAGAAGTPDPVHVGLLVLWALVVQHVRDVVDVDTAGGHVGGDQHVHLAVPERAQRSEEHTSELQSRFDLVCRLLLEKKNDSLCCCHYSI